MEPKRESTNDLPQLPSRVDDFKVVFNGIVLDSQLSEPVKTKYYELCCSQGRFLHENVPKGQRYELVIGMIRETVEIADAIRANRDVTSLDSLTKWYDNLKGYEAFGMSVSFMLTRLDRLMNLASEASADAATYTEMTIKRDQAQEKDKVLELELEQVNQSIQKLHADLGSLNLEMLVAEFEDVVKAPW